MDGDAFNRKLSGVAMLAFLISISLSMLLVVFIILNRLDVERLSMERIILEKTNIANEALSRLLFKTQTLSIFAKKGYTAEEFEQISINLIDDPAILNMIIAPGGVVSDVYPLAGNEAVVGFDYFSESNGNKEAIQAMETGELVLGGPFNAVQGGQVIVGRLPVYTDPEDGEEEFWGLVSVSLKYPDVLNAAGLSEMRLYGFDYELWRINPDDGQKQVIAGNSFSERERPHYVEEKITIQNAEWFFRIYPIKFWYERTSIWIVFFVGIGVSVLIAAVLQNNYELKNLKEQLETLSHTDMLTGIYNRRYFMESAVSQLGRSERLNASSAVIMMDIDHFKKINDSFGHSAGDKVLREIAAAVKNTLRPYDLFGRYGGEEFIILASDIDEDGASCLAERIRTAIEEFRFNYEGAGLSVTVSIGISPLNSASGFDDAINKSDQALYAAKHGGRNRVELYTSAAVGV